MRQHLAAAVAAIALVAVATAPSAPASAADAKSEALALINDLRGSLETLAETAESAATRVASLSVSGGSSKNKTVAEAEIKALAADIAALDTKLRALDAKVSSLTASKTTKTTTGSSSSSGSASSGSSSSSSGTGFRVTCEVSDRTAGVGDSVTYTAVVSGGTKPYSYSWTGAFEGNGSSQKASFLDPGTYREKVTVTDKGKKVASDDCPKVEIDDTFSDGVDDDAADRAKNAKLVLSEPVANAKLTAGKSATIRWKATGLASSDQLDVYLEDATAENVYYIATSLDKGADGKGSYTWPSAGTVASAFVPYGAYTLRVCTVDGEVCAAGKVTIVKPAS
jgi:hypothetical protein